MVNDILSNLGQAYPHVIAQILSYLEPEELCILSCVSQNTRDIVVNDPSSRRRREVHLKALQELKQEVGHENWPIKKTSPEVKSENRIALNEVKNTQVTSNKNDVAAAEVDASCIRLENVTTPNLVNSNSTVNVNTNNTNANTSSNSSIDLTLNSTLNSTINSTFNTTSSTTSNTTTNTTSNSSSNITSTTTSNATSSSTVSRSVNPSVNSPTPNARLFKRRRVDVNGNVFHIISSTPKIMQCRRGSLDSEHDHDSGFFEECKSSKGKSRNRKEPTAGSKASKRHLKRL